MAMARKSAPMPEQISPAAWHSPLRVMIIEDNSADAELIVAVLKRAGYPLAYDIVDSPRGLEQTLKTRSYDLVICDQNMITWTGIDALEIVRAAGKDIPFVLTSAVIGDEAAVEYIKQGAADYVLKHRLDRVPAIVGRALQEKAHRGEEARLQETIQAAKREWELTFDAVPDMVLQIDDECRIQRANRAVAEFANLGFTQIIGRKCFEVLLGANERPAGCPHEKAKASEKEQRGEFADARSGQIFEATVSPIRGRSGAVGGCVCVMRDVTARRRAEEALNSSEIQYRRLFEAAKDGILIINAATAEVTDINPHLMNLLGYPREEFLGKKLCEIAAFRSFEAGKILCNELQKNGYIHYQDLSLEASDGHPVDVEMVSTAYQAGSLEVIQCNIRDITERKRAQKALSQLASIVESSIDAIIGKTLDGTIVSWNRAAERMYGYTAEEVKGRPVSMLAGPDRFNEQVELLERIKKGEHIDPIETVRVKKTGEKIDVSFSVSPIRNEAGLIVGASTIERDITERKRSEEALRQANQRFETLLKYSPLSIIAVDLNGKVTDWNPAAERMYGWKEEELLGQALPILALQELKDLRREFESLPTGKAVAAIQVELSRKDGSLIPTELAIAPLYDKGGRHSGDIAISLDITGRKLLEDQLRQAQKMEAVGRLAGGVAHDFNNLLGVIIGYGELLLQYSNPASPQHKHIEQIKKAAERGAALTRQLLAFSRKQVLEPKVLDINTIVTESEKLVRRLIGENIELITVLESHLGRTRVDPGQIDQVIMNLALNSKDAMPEGGKIAIETANVELDESYAQLHAGVRPRSYVMLAISDTGSGMDKETQAHIFEPFFTTKAPGKGTGLGLSTVYGIVRQSNGHIFVYSEPGKGTTFRIYLPRVQAAVQQAKTSDSRRPLEGTETILLAEDESSLRRLAQTLLQQKGYTVLEAKDSEEAVRVAAEHQGPIDLLLTDVVMPGINGRQLAEQLSASRPGMKVIYMSGYTDDAIVNLGVLEYGINFLGKPFSQEALLRKVRDVLEGKSASREKNLCHA